MQNTPSSNTPLRLYYTEGSPYARICRMAMRERKLTSKFPVEEIVTTLRDPESTVLPFNPVGRVPALVLPDGTTLTETTLILQWLDTLTDQPPLMPDSAQGLAAYGCVVGLLDGIATWNRELRRPESERSKAVLDLETSRANRVADTLENAVGQGHFSSVDAAYLALAAVLGYAERRHTVWKWRNNRPHLEHWFNQASTRPAFLETMPPPSGI